MSKVAGSYESVVRGVSEQVPQDRRSGQHFEQVNLISDPVRGLARRHGSVMQDEKVLAIYDANTFAAMLADSARHQVMSFYVAGVDYDLIYRSTADTAGLGQTGFAYLFNKATGKFLPIVYKGGDAVLAQLISGGISATVNIGQYIYLAGNTVLPSYATVDSWNVPANLGKLACWVRGGAYSRTFKVSVIRPDGTKVTGQYKTVAASYPGLLDTSDILTTDPDYQKKVNDRTNAYNSAVTAWIGTSAADITPENIAGQLAASLTGQGVTGVSVVNGTVCVSGSTFTDMTADDGGDGSLLHAVGAEVAAPDLVSTIHYAGKLVRVRPPSANNEGAYYLKAYPKDNTASGFTSVFWREAPGFTMTPTSVFVMGVVVGGTLYLASTAAGLASIAGGSHPEFKANTVGDDLTCPLPYFFGRRIDFMHLFQDRLIIGSGATLNVSRPGDYLNFFRQSVLSVIANDPWEGYALGSDGDTIRYGTTYDRNLLMYGKRFQYTITGRVAFDPRTASIVTYTAFKDAALAEPKSSGNLVFYARYSGRPGEEKTALQQMQAGLVSDTSEGVSAAQQLDNYVKGKPVQIVPRTEPNVVFLRTETQRQSLYVYAYLDGNNGERMFDAWSRWDWNPAVGSIIGASDYGSDLVVYLLRSGQRPDGSVCTWVAAERFVLDTRLSGYPYADSLRPATAYATPAALSFINPVSAFAGDACVAIGGNGPRKFVGAPLTAYTAFAAAYPAQLADTWVGINYAAYVTPTNPYMKDRYGKTVIAGRLTLASVAVSVADTGGMTITVQTSRGVSTPTNFSGRVLGRTASILGQQPIVTTVVSGSIGAEIRECKYTLASKAWLPLTITAIDWVGQSFNNVRRVS